jgi:hypothetical protein
MLLIRCLPIAWLENLLHGNACRDRVKLRILDACSLLELGIRLGFGRDELWARAKGREVPSDGARLEQLEAIFLLNSTQTHETPRSRRGEETYDYKRYLAKRLVLEVRRLLMLGHRHVHGNELIRDVALFGYQSHAPRAGRTCGSVKFECHAESIRVPSRECVKMWGGESWR